MRVFIGSSRESLTTANTIAAYLRSKSITCEVWDSASDFIPSRFTLESLEFASNNYEGAIFVFAEDDIVRSRKKQQAMPRDNVMFELGLFMGKLGHKNVAAACTSNDIKIMSDLLGYTTINAYTDQSKLENDLDLWIENLEPLSNVEIQMRQELDSKIPLEQRWEYAEEIIFVNYAASAFTISNKIATESVYPSSLAKLMIQKINDGVKFKFLITSPGSYADYDASSYKMRIISRADKKPENAITMSESALKQLAKRLGKNSGLEYRVTNVALPYGAMLVVNDQKHQMLNSIKIDLYSPFLSNDRERRSFILYPTNNNYSFFYSNITDLWNNGSTHKQFRTHYSKSLLVENESISTGSFDYTLKTYDKDTKVENICDVYSSLYIFVIDGEVDVMINKKSTVLQKQDAVIIPRQKKYSLFIKKSTKIIQIKSSYK